mmetsp:Transcript_7612/g.10361  ORF Transcript_7612/g.10361 Transcript_7612/m.10361 type:complete len:193 (-) Transcript_7612:327-905(-)|eukprot:CAMPEP_0185729004 /NCGR_PEP_ID=MMETSP1171-20130828/4414_1 /TAXON_ID=374046 /ORGANISM="Helicotheca tamensis, Strain CCMP826" /LENGTH=192 /DNA_ID=CAMNT_0028397767 /DNA_START=138 /DNA_END=716 /DNA_ORIENTATION=-
MMTSIRLITLYTILAMAFNGISAFTTPRTFMSTTTTAPPREKTDRQIESPNKDLVYPDNDEALGIRGGPLEYLQDDMTALRGDDDPFHILLLSATFDKPRITISYVSGSISYVLDMPDEEAHDLSKFAAENGMSCLGTWSREECQTLGRQLQVRDIVCRIVPYCEGGQRGWQAKDASAGESSSSSGGSFGFD